MDYSMEYTEMCKEAIELQEWWSIEEHPEKGMSSSNRNAGDFFSLGGSDKIGLVCGKVLRISVDKPSYYEYRIDGDIGGFYRIQRSNKYKGLLDGYAIWLPRQDQLQSMLKSKGVSSMISSLNYHDLSGVIFDTLEKRWLAIVMEENYNKEWDADDMKWVVYEDN